MYFRPSHISLGSESRAAYPVAGRLAAGDVRREGARVSHGRGRLLSCVATYLASVASS